MTVEGLAQDGKLHPLQELFLDHDAAHCGFCTPGMLVTLHAFLKENKHPTDDEIKEAIGGNLCRCTGYVQIISAVIGWNTRQGLARNIAKVLPPIAPLSACTERNSSPRRVKMRT